MSEATLVILPGWGGSHETWADFVALAKPHFADVVVIDLPCFGDEPCPTEVWGVEDYSHFVEERLREYSTRQIILLGHSFGGAVATHLAAMNSDIVDKLILSGAAVFRPKNHLRRVFFGLAAKLGTLGVALIPSKTVKARAKRILYRIAGSPDYDKTDGVQREIFKKIIRQDLGHVLSTISLPTCVIQGTADTYVPYRAGERIARNIPHASFVAVKDGIHGLHTKRKDELLDAIRTFASNT